MKNPLKFFQEVKQEAFRVTWPTKEETFRLSVIVISIAVVVGMFLGAIDLAFSRIIGFFINN